MQNYNNPNLPWELAVTAHLWIKRFPADWYRDSYGSGLRWLTCEPANWGRAHPHREGRHPIGLQPDGRKRGKRRKLACAWKAPLCVNVCSATPGVWTSDSAFFHLSCQYISKEFPDRSLGRVPSPWSVLCCVPTSCKNSPWHLLPCKVRRPLWILQAHVTSTLA